jgi:hypothetical protein
LESRIVESEDRRNDGGTLVENAEFLRFAHHHGFKVRACRPYRAKTKGKVERPIRYVRDSFFYGRTFLNDSDLDAQAERWLAHVANVRCHATTKERPIGRFELAALKPLALKAYRSLILTRSAPKKPVSLPAVAVERRPLAHYDRLTGARA